MKELNLVNGFISYLYIGMKKLLKYVSHKAIKKGGCCPLLNFSG